MMKTVLFVVLALQAHLTDASSTAAPTGSTKSAATAGTSAPTTAGTKAGTKAGTSAGTKAGTSAGTSAGTKAGTSAGTKAAVAGSKAAVVTTKAASGAAGTTKKASGAAVTTKASAKAGAAVTTKASAKAGAAVTTKASAKAGAAVTTKASAKAGAAGTTKASTAGAVTKGAAVTVKPSLAAVLANVAKAYDIQAKAADAFLAMNDTAKSAAVSASVTASISAADAVALGVGKITCKTGTGGKSSTQIVLKIDCASLTTDGACINLRAISVCTAIGNGGCCAGDNIAKVACINKTTFALKIEVTSTANRRLADERGLAGFLVTYATAKKTAAEVQAAASKDYSSGSARWAMGGLVALAMTLFAC